MGPRHVVHVFIWILLLSSIAFAADIDANGGVVTSRGVSDTGSDISTPSGPPEDIGGEAEYLVTSKTFSPPASMLFTKMGSHFAIVTPGNVNGLFTNFLADSDRSVQITQTILQTTWNADDFPINVSGGLHGVPGKRPSGPCLVCEPKHWSVNIGSPDAHRIQITGWIPYDHVDDPTPFSSLAYKGDAPKNVGTFSRDRASFRIRQVVWVVPNESKSSSGILPASSPSDLVGQSESFDRATSLDTSGFLSAAALADKVRGAPLKVDWATATPTVATISVTRLSSTKVSAHLRMGAANPLVSGSPDIDWDIVVTIDASSTPASYTVTGARDGFPAQDIYIDDDLVDSHDPRVTGDGLFSLFPPMEYNISKSGTLR